MSSTRRFNVITVNGEFVITELAETEGFSPYSGYDTSVSRQAAWNRARSQPLPTVFVGLDGSRKELGIVFDSETFERAAYSGYVGYGLSMSDGYYAPIQFENWVSTFRKNPSLDYGNDCGPEVKSALPLYLEYLANV